jgi:hypothetical protein
MYDHGDGLKFCDAMSKVPADANVVVGAVLRVPPGSSDVDPGAGQAISRFFPGEMVGDSFLPGQRMASANGEFIPAATVRKGDINDNIKNRPGSGSGPSPNFWLGLFKNRPKAQTGLGLGVGPQAWAYVVKA